MRFPLSALALSLLLGCTSYEAEPLEPRALLRELDALRSADPLEPLPGAAAPVTSAYAPEDGLDLREAAALAVTRNPSLARLRARLGVGEAQLVVAGLLPDPVVSWGSMDAVSGLIVDGKAESPSWLAGFGLTWRVPRPGEFDAQEGVARAGLGVAQAELAGAEWRLVREVHLAYLSALVAERRRAQVARLLALATRSEDFARRAVEAGATTGLQSVMAQLGAQAVRAALLRAEGDALRARQALNALLGLPPAAAWRLQSDLGAFPLPKRLEVEDPEALTRAALGRRPDLERVQAAYQAAEEQLRLECRRQLPRFTVGTGFSLQLPIFTRFNGPAIERARAARDEARLAARAAVADARREVHAAWLEVERAHVLARLYADQLRPSAARALELTERAFEAREVTPLEILSAQRQVVEVQTQGLSAFRRFAAARVRLDAAAGRLLPTYRTPLTSSLREEDQ